MRDGLASHHLSQFLKRKNKGGEERCGRCNGIRCFSSLEEVVDLFIWGARLAIARFGSATRALFGLATNLAHTLPGKRISHA